jgi:DNA polymerase III epsilon subunit-like protein
MSEHVMIDLETLGTEPNSVILSLGAVKFDRNKIYEDDGLYLQMRWQDQLDSGGIVTEGTIRFWLGQPRAARDVILNKSGAEETRCSSSRTQCLVQKAYQKTERLRSLGKRTWLRSCAAR